MVSCPMASWLGRAGCGKLTMGSWPGWAAPFWSPRAADGHLPLCWRRHRHLEAPVGNLQIGIKRLQWIQIWQKRHVNNHFLPQPNSNKTPPFNVFLFTIQLWPPLMGLPFCTPHASLLQKPNCSLPCFALPRLARRRGNQLTQGVRGLFSRRGKKKREIFLKTASFPQEFNRKTQKTAQSRTRPSGARRLRAAQGNLSRCWGRRAIVLH